MAEVVVLGSGTSNGVPMLGVEYPPEFLANPKNHRTRSSIVILGPEGNLLVDCAPELRLQLVREKVMMVDAVIVTHTHADHIMGMDDLRSFCILTRRDMPIYTTPEYQEDIRRVYSYAFKEFPPGIEVPRFSLRDVQDKMSLCGLEVETFLVYHGATPVIGLRVGGFAYMTDVNNIPPEAEAKLQGLDTLIMDAVRHRPHPTHFNLEQALEVVAQLKPRQAFFTHLSHDYDHDKANAALPAGVALAYDGLRVPL
jgi:phosphoribosyl 1,2-cyclic phosphate phosphodiesterase